MIHIRLEFKPQDCWIGVFWVRNFMVPIEYRRQWRWDVWVCILPMLPIHISWKGAEKS